MLSRRLFALTKTMPGGFPGGLRLRNLWQRLTSHLMVSSLYVLGGTAVSAVFGFLFWFLAARLTSASDVGITNAAIAGSMMLISLFDMGITPALIHFAAAEDNPVQLVNTSIGASWLLSTVGAVGFVVGLPLWSPGLMPIRGQWLLVLLFIGFTIFNHILSLQDAAMLAQKRPQHIFWRNLACNAPPVLLLFPMMQWMDGFTALMWAYLLPNIVVGLVVSLIILPRHLPDYRFFGRFDRHVFARTRQYGVANHASNLIWGLPTFLLPVLAVNLVSAAETGYFAIAWTIVNGLLIIPRAVTLSLFVEGSREQTNVWSSARRVLGLILALGLPVLLLVWLGGDFALGLFGRDYVDMTLLRILLASFVPFTLNSIYFVILRVQKRLTGLLIFATALSGTVLALVLTLTPQFGIRGVAIGWLGGNLAALCLALGWLVAGRIGFGKVILLLAVGTAVSILAYPQLVLAQAENGVTPIVCEETAFSTPVTNAITLTCDLEQDGSLDDSLVIVDRQFDRNGRLSWDDPLLQQDAIWLFDHENDGLVELVLNFYPQDDAVVAELFPNVEYVLNEDEFNLVGPVHPTVRVVAADGYWLRDSQPNVNVDIAVDGLVNAAFDVVGRLADVYSNDGVVDFSIQVRDRSGNGRSDFDWRTLHFPDPAPRVASTLANSYLMVNTADDEPPLAPMLPWPFLGSETFGYLFQGPHSETPPPIQVDWTTGQVVTVGEFVSSRGNDNQWFVYSTRPLVSGELNAPNFESPFAWYDLAEDDDGKPELALRVVHYEVEDPDFVNGRFPQPFNAIRYSWDQTNDGFWNYKLGLLGNYPISSTVQIEDLEMTLLPYDAAPDWVTSREWGPVTFVSAEMNVTGEGIYEWDFPAWFTESYFWGEKERPYSPFANDMNFDAIQPGFRGEYRFEKPTAPVSLYLSPVDNQLHLRDAEAGLWQIDADSSLTYADTNGDGFVDRWVHVEVGTAVTQTQQLMLSDNHLIYADGSELIIKETNIQPMLWETAPPTNHKEWLALSEKLTGLAPFEPAGLDNVNTRFAGEAMEVTGVELRDYRRFADGSFRFVLNVTDSVNVTGEALFDLEAAGEYVVFVDDDFEVVPATAPQLTIDVQIPEQVETGAPVQFAATVTNNGLIDAAGLTVVARAQTSSGWEEIGSQVIDVWVEQPAQVAFSWQTNTAVSTPFMLQIVKDDVVLAESSLTVDVVEVKRPLLAQSNKSPVTGWMATVLLVLIPLVVGTAVWLNRSVQLSIE